MEGLFMLNLSSFFIAFTLKISVNAAISWLLQLIMTLEESVADAEILDCDYAD